MAEQTAVVEPVVTAPVTTATPTVDTSVKVEAAPELDLLTRVNQFKLPDAPEKIENPPEQPEFASITDPVAKKAAAEAVERMRRGMQADYTKKLQDAQNLVNQSKSWTPQRIQQELLTNPEFLQAAQMIQGTQAPQERQLTQEEYSALTDAEKQQLAAVPQLKNELFQMKQQAQQEQLLSSISQKDLTLRQRFPNYDPLKVNEAAQRFGKLTPADAREYIYKADNFETEVKKAYEYGKLEGQGKLNSKLNALSPSGVSTTSNEGLPVRVKGESDQTYFVKLAQFRLAQSRAQK
jgi:hypothetical protein